MRHVSVGRTIKAPAEHAWRLLAEFESWPKWGSSIKAVESEASHIAEGATGRVQTVAGVWLPFRITAVDSGTFWEWGVAGFNATGHRVTRLDKATCRVEFSTPWISAPYLAVLSRALTKLQRLAEHR